LFGNAGQANYGSAKGGLASFTLICAQELGRYGVTANAIAPVARTRMTENLGLGDAPEGAAFDPLDPANISPLVVWLGSPESAQVTGRVFLVDGDRISVAQGWHRGPTATNAGDRWNPATLGAVVPDLVAKAQPNATMFD
jgi:NAD(P)-dependent dehydrogenase (short-subunit alcohol dehydrogenase family)